MKTLAVTILALTLTACGGGSNDSSPAPQLEPTPSEPVQAPIVTIEPDLDRCALTDWPFYLSTPETDFIRNAVEDMVRVLQRTLTGQMTGERMDLFYQIEHNNLNERISNYLDEVDVQTLCYEEREAITRAISESFSDIPYRNYQSAHGFRPEFDAISQSFSDSLIRRYGVGITTSGGSGDVAE